jgi:hypothetical protein
MVAVGVCYACLVHVVVIDDTAGEWARQRGSVGRSAEAAGIFTLRSGLDALASHFKF